MYPSQSHILPSNNSILSSSAPSPSLVSQSPAFLPNALSVPEPIKHIKHLEHKISLFGPGPHTPSETAELNRLLVILQKVKVEYQKQQHKDQVQLHHQQQHQAPQQQQQQSLMSSGSQQSSSGEPGVGIFTQSSTVSQQPKLISTQAVAASSGVAAEAKILDRRRLQELVKEVDPMEQLEEDVEEVLLQLADDFIEGVVTNSCQLARHRKSNVLEIKDVKLHLERNWNMVLPGYGTDDIRTYKKSCQTEAHKQRLALIRKTLKKY